MGSNSRLVVIILLLFYVCSVALGIKDIMGFQSVDEEMFIKDVDIRWLVSDGNMLYVVRQFSYSIWSKYISYCYKLSPIIAPLVNIFVLFYVSLKLSKYVKHKEVFILVLLGMPSVYFFSMTYLRDIAIMITVLLLLSLLLEDRTTQYRRVLLYLLFAFIIILRPITGIVVLASYTLSKLRLFRKKISYKFLLFKLFVGILLLSSSRWIQLYSNIVVSVEPNIDKFGLIGFTKDSLSNYSITATFLFNWIGYWFTYHPGNIDRISKIVFLFESLLYFVLILRVLLKGISHNYAFSSVYSFSWMLILSSVLFASIESGTATVLRHKLVFIPPLLFLVFGNSKKEIQNFVGHAP